MDAIGTAAPGFSVRLGDFLVNYRVRITVAVCVTAAFVAVCLRVSPHHPLDVRDPASMLGLGLIVCGLGLRTWAAGILCKGESLATRGPYGVCRHPLYLGSLLLLAGALIIFPGVQIGGGVLALNVALLLFTLRREEARMARRHGTDWIRYRLQVPFALVPCRLAGLDAEWSLNRWARNREYNVVLAMLLIEAAAIVCHVGAK